MLTNRKFFLARIWHEWTHSLSQYNIFLKWSLMSLVFAVAFWSSEFPQKSSLNSAWSILIFLQLASPNSSKFLPLRSSKMVSVGNDFPFFCAKCVSLLQCYIHKSNKTNLREQRFVFILLTLLRIKVIMQGQVVEQCSVWLQEFAVGCVFIWQNRKKKAR